MQHIVLIGIGLVFVILVLLGFTGFIRTTTHYD